jgi:shikimate dehydrogenase
MKKSSATEIYGVLGYPAKHSLSPVMHNAAFRALDINAEYKIFEVKPEDLQSFLTSFVPKNIAGLNVTIPYKEKVIPFLDSISEEVKLIQAVNTIKVSEDKLKGYNTDGEGFLGHISEVFDFNPEGKTIAVLGAGGASRAVCVYLCQAHASRIAIYDIDKAKLKDLIDHLKNRFKEVIFQAADSIDELPIEESALLINATPIGMKETDPLLVNEYSLHKNLLVYDLIYKPDRTRLLEVAKAKGLRVSNGLGMLLNQAMLSFKIWTGKNAPKEVMEKALLPMARLVLLFLLAFFILGNNPSFAELAKLQTSQNVTLEDKIIGTTFKNLAKAYIAMLDIKKFKESKIAELNRMDTAKFREHYAKTFGLIKECPLLNAKFGIDENLTRQEAVSKLNSLDKKEMYEIVDSIPDTVVTNQFKMYLDRQKEEIKNKNLVEQINYIWDKVLNKTK